MKAKNDNKVETSQPITRNALADNLSQLSVASLDFKWTVGLVVGILGVIVAIFGVVRANNGGDQIHNSHGGLLINRSEVGDVNFFRPFTEIEKDNQKDEKAHKIESEVPKVVGEAERRIQAGQTESAVTLLTETRSYVDQIEYSNPKKKFSRGLAMIDNALGLSMGGERGAKILEEAAIEARQAPSALLEGTALLNLANVEFAMGDMHSSAMDAIKGLDSVRSEIASQSDLEVKRKDAKLNNLRAGLYGALGRIAIQRYGLAKSSNDKKNLYNAGSRYFRLAVQLGDLAGDKLGKPARIQNLAVLEFLVSHYVAAARLGYEARILNQGQYGTPDKLGTNIELLGECHLHLGRMKQSSTEFRQALVLFEDSADLGNLCMTMQQLGKLLSGQKQTRSAALLVAKVSQLEHKGGVSCGSIDEPALKLQVATVSRSLGSARFQRIEELAAHTSTAEIVQIYHVII